MWFHLQYDYNKSVFYLKMWLLFFISLFQEEELMQQYLAQLWLLQFFLFFAVWGEQINVVLVSIWVIQTAVGYAKPPQGGTRDCSIILVSKAVVESGNLFFVGKLPVQKYQNYVFTLETFLKMSVFASLGKKLGQNGGLTKMPNQNLEVAEVIIFNRLHYSTLSLTKTTA